MAGVTGMLEGNADTWVESVPTSGANCADSSPTVLVGPGVSPVAPAGSVGELAAAGELGDPDAGWAAEAVAAVLRWTGRRGMFSASPNPRCVRAAGLDAIGPTKAGDADEAADAVLWIAGVGTGGVATAAALGVVLGDEAGGGSTGEPVVADTISGAVARASGDPVVADASAAALTPIGAPRPARRDWARVIRGAPGFAERDTMGGAGCGGAAMAAGLGPNEKPRATNGDDDVAVAGGRMPGPAASAGAYGSVAGSTGAVVSDRGRTASAGGMGLTLRRRAIGSAGA